MAGTSARVRARMKAREVRARRVVAERERMKEVHKLQEGFFEADALREEHEVRAARCVVELLALGESVPQVADLLEIEPKDVRALRALAQTAGVASDGVMASHSATEGVVEARDPHEPPQVLSGEVAESYAAVDGSDGEERHLAGIDAK